ncbi:MAG: T9SS type A sorting domain-containing protein [Ignavibacteriota bacterium]
MKNYAVFLSLLSLILLSPDLVAQTTHFTGIADVLYSVGTYPTDCGGNSKSNEIDSIQLIYFHRQGFPDSISYTLYSPNGNPTMLTKSIVQPDTFFTKSDADSIIFPLKFYVENGHNHGSIGTDCWPEYTNYWAWSGIARISTATASVSKDRRAIDKFNIFPNPTNSLLKLGSTAKIIRVFDNLGRTVISVNSDDETVLKTLDVSELVTGYYTLLLENAIKTSICKFVKY